ncbi:MAG: hypothetical protein IBX71_02885 [Candidatus Desulforudis sp.]|nr:hypothetical protein [Desulforudis sp.]
MDLSTLQALGPTFSAAATATLALLTFFSVRAARSMAHEMYETRLANFRPILYTVLKLHGPNADRPPCLFIRNVGPGPAMDIEVHCRGDLQTRNHIAFFGPGQKVELTTSDADSNGKQREVRVSVRFKDIFNNPITIDTVYRYEAGAGKGLVFPVDTTMEGRVCKR